jgi:sulfoxide reductase heme-binding subunit YedZ
MADLLNRWLRKAPTWVIYLAGGLLAARLFWLGATGGLGVEPIRELEHRYGLLGLQFLVATLAVTPIRRYLGVNLLRFRRAMGLTGFYIICAHLGVWLFLDIKDVHLIWQDIVKRPYITIGMAALVLMIPLALSSNNWAVRRLGRNWRLVHRLTYVVVPLGAVHFVMLTKGWQIEPLLYLAGILCLLSLRLVPRQRLRPA